MGATVNITLNGKTYAVPAEQAQQVLDQNRDARVEAPEEQVSRIGAEHDDRVYGGAAGTIVAGGAAAFSGLTGGGSDALLSAAGAGQTLQKLQDAHPIVSTIGTIAGSLIDGGAGALASKAGEKVAARVVGEGAGLGTRLARAAVSSGVEGAALGAGQGVHELALSDDPLTIERAASVLSSNMLYGGAIGAGVGTVAKLTESGLVRARGMLDERAAMHAADNLGADGGAVAADLAGLDAKALRGARETELEAIETARVPQREELASDLASFRQDLKEQKLFIATKGAEERSLREVGAISYKADKQLDRLLNNPKALASNPKQAMGALQQQEHALELLAKHADELKLRERWSAPSSTHLDDIKSSDFATYDEFAAARTKAAATPRVDSRITALDNAAGALERNRALQARITELTGERTSTRLTAIDDAKDALVTGGAAKRGMGEQLVHGAAFSAATGAASFLGPLAPLVGAKAAQFLTERVFGRLGRASGELANRSSAALGKFLDVGAKVARSAPVLATKVLTGVRYAVARADDTPIAPGKSTQLADAFRSRSAELRSQTAYDPTGRPMMRPEARAAIADRLAPIRAVSPVLADRIETIASRRLEFLATKLPRRPDLAVMRTGPDRWQPSELAMRQFARYAAAVEDPHGVFERLADGSVTPEDAEVMRTVYPEQMASFSAGLMEQLPTLRKQLPYQRRLALSIFSGVPVDPAMDPRVLGVLQGQFAAEPGSEGGTQAPTAQPQFGSVKASAPTPAQDRAQGDIS